ncbi:MAG: tyrosine-type recombinase/integrase [Patescibacteria group bacterium]
MTRIIELPEIDNFLLYIKTQNYSPETLYNYEQDLKQLQNFLDEEKLSFTDMSKQKVNEYKAYLVSRDRKQPFTGITAPRRLESRSINRNLSTFRTYLKYLIDMDKPVPIPPDAIKMVKTDKKHGQVAELPDLIRLIESPQALEKDPFVGLRNRAMLEVLLATGMRISELVSLNRDQLDSSGKLFIRGKGRKERFVYLTDRAVHCLETYLGKRNDKLPAMFISLRGSNASKSTNRVTPYYLQMKIKQYRETLRIIVPTSAHSLRHGFATYLAESGANPAAIQILLGHESLDTTTRYVHASDKFAEETHKKYHPLP